MLFNREPARILAVIGAALALAINLGVDIDNQRFDLIMDLATTGLILLTGEAIRSQVVAKTVADKQIEIAKAADVSTPTEQIIAQAKKETA